MTKRIAVLMGMIWGIAALAETNITGGDVSGIWEASGSPFLIEGEITIPSTDTLTIEPGVEVNFQGHYKLIVYGWLLAEGTEVDSILFTAANTSEGWHGIRFIDAPDSSHLSYCIIQYGKLTSAMPDSCGGGIYCLNSNPAIANSRISGNSAVCGGGIYCLYSNPVISNNIIYGNSSAEDMYGGGICCINSNPIIYENAIISNQSQNGNGKGIYCAASSPIISGNDIIFNSSSYGGYGGGIYCTASSPLIENNYIAHNSGGGMVGMVEEFAACMIPIPLFRVTLYMIIMRPTRVEEFSAESPILQLFTIL